MTNLDLPTGPVPQWCENLADTNFIAHGCSWRQFAARLIQKYVPEPISPELQAARDAQHVYADCPASVVEIAGYAIERFKELEGRGNG